MVVLVVDWLWWFVVCVYIAVCVVYIVGVDLCGTMAIRRHVLLVG